MISGIYKTIITHFLRAGYSNNIWFQQDCATCHTARETFVLWFHKCSLIDVLGEAEEAF